MGSKGEGGGVKMGWGGGGRGGENMIQLHSTLTKAGQHAWPNEKLKEPVQNYFPFRCSPALTFCLRVKKPARNKNG